MPKFVIKKDKTKELYSEDKVIRSLKNVGAGEKTIKEILEKINKNLPEIITTKKLYQFIFEELSKIEKTQSYKYNLKKGIEKLGPTGYPFEKFIAHLLKLHGYTAHHNLFLQGRCLTYEIDILAEKENKLYVGECKFHTFRKNDLHVVLYSYARFLDIKEKLEKESYPLIVTNTKFTTEAIKFAECYNIKLIAWNYPKENLHFLIENKKAYPITIFPEIPKKALENLFNYDIVLITDFISRDKNYLRKISGLSIEEIEKISEEIKKLI